MLCSVVCGVCACGILFAESACSVMPLGISQRGMRATSTQTLFMLKYLCNGLSCLEYGAEILVEWSIIYVGGISPDDSFIVYDYVISYDLLYIYIYIYNYKYICGCLSVSGKKHVSFQAMAKPPPRNDSVRVEMNNITIQTYYSENSWFAAGTVKLNVVAMGRRWSGYM